MASRKHTVAAQEAFVVTVGVPSENRQVHCRRVLTVLDQAGYRAGPTSNEAILALAAEVHRIDDQETDPA